MSNHSKTESPILLFDGTCVLCDGFFQWVLRYDKNQMFKFATIQSETGQLLIYHHGIQNVDSVILIADDQPFVESNAVIKSVSMLGGLWTLINVLYIFPRFLRDFVYRWVARNRYKWFGQKSCMIPSSEVKRRFV